MRKKIGNFRKVVLKDNTSGFGSPASDPLRQDLNSFWAKDKKNNEDVIAINQENIKKINFIDNVNFNIHQKELSSVVLNLPPQTQKYTDITFDYTTPFNITKKENIDNTFENISLASKFELKSNFNYSVKQYRDFSNSDETSEVDLLNYYMVLGRDILKDPNLENIVSLYGNIDDALLNSDKTAKEYFSKYPNIYQNAKPLDSKNNVINQQSIKALFSNIPKSIIIGDREFGKNLNIESRKNLFSNFIILNFFKERSSEIMKIVKDTGFSDVLMSKIYDTHNSLQESAFIINKLNYERYKNKESINTKFGNKTSVKLDLEKSISQENLKYFDMKEFIAEVLQSTTSSDLFYNFTLGTSTRPLFLGNKQVQETAAASINARMFALKMDALIKKNLRSYKDIVDGKSCYSEVLSVVIEKTRAFDGSIVQTYFFENNDSDLLCFIDTQIKSNKQYRYKIYYYLGVIGNSYNYKKTNSNSGTIYFNVNNDVDFRVIRVPVDPVVVDALTIYAAQKTPPAAPIVMPIPYRGIKNKIKFNFMKNSDRYKAKFITIEPQDVERLQFLFQSQDVPDNLRNPETKILFQSELNIGKNPHILEENDALERYEIYKTTTPPTKYEDFVGKLYTTITSTSFVDEQIIPNKKYYYMFRALNSENFVSNPTNVYEIEIVENSGAIYHIIKPYEFDINKVTDESRMFKKYAFITPSFIQTMMNLTVETDTAQPSAIKLGPSNPNVWNKDYKIRITSKDTGRKIDINFKLIYKQK